MKVKQFLRLNALLILLLLLLGLPAWAQENQSESQDDEIQAMIDATIEVWGKDVVTDSSKAEEYGEIPHGFLLSAFRSAIDWRNDRYLDIRARNVGLNDGQYGMDYGVAGRYKLYIDYSKIPHLFSKDGETIWNEATPGVWRISDAVQRAIQDLNPAPPGDPAYSLAKQYAFVSDLLMNAHPQSLGIQRNRGTVGFSYDLNTKWKYAFEYFRENRDGTRPLGTSFGFSWATELPERIDYNTDRIHTGVEYKNERTNFAVAYDLSLFRNNVQTMTWDNPLRIDDRTYSSAYVSGDGTSQGRAQLPTDNNANTINVSGGTDVGKGRVTGSFAYSAWTDSVQLLPFTINSAITSPGLVIRDASGNAVLNPAFKGDLRNTTVNLRYYLPVGSSGNFTANYRLYDQKNDSTVFEVEEYVRLDQALEESEDALVPHRAYKYNTLDFDYQWRRSKLFHWNAGYSFNRWDREERDTSQTDTNTFKAGLDVFPSDNATIHVKYQHAQRRSDAFDLGSATYDVIPLRRFDTANLNLNQFRVVADFAVGSNANLSVNGAVQDNNYLDTLYGLQKAQTYTIGADFSYSVSNRSSVNAWYEHARVKTDQTGRQSGGSPATTTDFDWAANINDKFDTVGLGYSLKFHQNKLMWDTNALYARANGFDNLSAGTAVRPTGAEDLPNSDDTDHFTFQTGLVTKKYKHVRFTIGYKFDRYLIKDFSEDNIQADLIIVQTSTGPSTAGTILLNARQPDYTYNTGWIGVIYSW